MQKILIGLSFAFLVLGANACKKEKSCEETNTCPVADPVKFSTSRDSSVVSGRAGNELNATVYVKNTDTKALNLKWKRINPNMPSTWELATCANADCYVPSVAEKEFTLAVGDSVSYKHVFRPQGNAGVGTVEAIFYDPTDSTRTVKKVYFKATAN